MKYSLFKLGTIKKRSNELKKDYTPVIILSILIFVVIVVFIVVSTVKNNNCLSMEELVMDAALEYADKNDMLPTLDGDTVTINLSKIPDLDLEFKGNTCKGNVVITLADGEYIKTFDLKNCSYCTTSKRYKMSKVTNEYPEGKSLISVDVVFNYYEITKNYTQWTNYLESKYISTELSEWDVYMPLDTFKWPRIPEPGELITYETEKKTYYSFRDKKWKFYKNYNPDYSDFSSTQPEGYSKKDTRTAIEAEPSEWSTNYPEVYDYRKIQSQTAFKWYYLDDDGNKVYYNNGNYVPSIEDEIDKEKYTEKEKETVTVYRYIDTMWRWYNGQERYYSSPMSEANKTYPYKDEELLTYTSWTSWNEESRLDDTNKSYREERTDIHQRYRAYFQLNSEEMLEEYVSREELESKMGMTIEEMKLSENLEVLIKYNYRYGK